MIQYANPQQTLEGAGQVDAAAAVVKGLESVFGNIGGVFGRSIHKMEKGMGVALRALVAGHRRGVISGDLRAKTILEFSDGGQRKSKGNRRNEVKQKLIQNGVDVSTVSGRVRWEIGVPIRVLPLIINDAGEAWHWVYGLALHPDASQQIRRVLSENTGGSVTLDPATRYEEPAQSGGNVAAGFTPGPGLLIGAAALGLIGIVAVNSKGKGAKA